VSCEHCGGDGGCFELDCSCSCHSGDAGTLRLVRNLRSSLRQACELLRAILESEALDGTPYAARVGAFLDDNRDLVATKTGRTP
jgi:hypothetical protein